jgi:hypothetical protein
MCSRQNEEHFIGIRVKVTIKPTPTTRRAENVFSAGIHLFTMICAKLVIMMK